MALTRQAPVGRRLIRSGSGGFMLYIPGERSIYFDFSGNAKQRRKDLRTFERKHNIKLEK